MLEAPPTFGQVAQRGPNLMVKAVAEREHYAMPSFGRYFVFAFGVMLPGHLIMTAALWWLER